MSQFALRVCLSCTGVKIPKIGNRGFWDRKTLSLHHPRKGHGFVFWSPKPSCRDFVDFDLYRVDAFAKFTRIGLHKVSIVTAAVSPCKDELLFVEIE